MSNEVELLRDKDGGTLLEIAGTSSGIRFTIVAENADGTPDWGGVVRVFHLRPCDLLLMHDALSEAGVFCGASINCKVFGLYVDNKLVMGTENHENS